MVTTERNSSADTAFELDVQILSDLGPEMDAGCSTNDGCAPSCQSSCTSNV